MAVWLSAVSAGHPLLEERSVVLISVKGWVDTRAIEWRIPPQSHSTAGKVRSIWKYNSLVGKQTRDLPTCSTVPQPTTLPRTTKQISTSSNFFTATGQCMHSINSGAYRHVSVCVRLSVCEVCPLLFSVTVSVQLPFCCCVVFLAMSCNAVVQSNRSQLAAFF
jgi:hypothetical protein